MIGYIPVNNGHRSIVKDIKVISVEEIVSQHCLLLMDVLFKKKVKRKKKVQKEIETVEFERVRGEIKVC